jgi:colanic acid/amylovoran biosynthesis protein
MAEVIESKPIRIFCPGGYTWVNKGDAALGLAMLQWLREIFVAPRISVMTFTPEEDARLYEVPTFGMPIRRQRRVFREIHRIGRYLPGDSWLVPAMTMAWVDLVTALLVAWARLPETMRNRTRRLLPRHVRVVVEELERADLIVAFPGGYLLAPREQDDWWLLHMPTFAVAHALGKPMILSPCSIGPFVPRYRKRVKRYLKWFDLIMLRERLSERFVVDVLGVDPARLTVSPDLALLLEAPTQSDPDVVAALGGAVDSGGLLAVSVRNHTFPGHPDPDEMSRRYFAHVSAAIQRLIDEHSAQAVIVAQSLEDLPASRRIAESVGRPGAVQLVADDFTPSQLQEIYQSCRCMFGTRMHANILSLAVGTPAFAIGYEPKTRGIMTMLGIERWMVEIDEVDASLVDSLESFWLEGAEAQMAIARPAIERVRGEIQTSGRLLRQLVGLAEGAAGAEASQDR